jgi:hypothetical protein
MIKYKDIVGYEGLYEVSSDGRVYSKNFNRFCGRRIRKIQKRKDGYMQIMLNKDKEKRCLKIHRLVAEAFLDNPNKYKDVNHINGNKSDNRVENLEWCNRSHNVTHAYRIGLKNINADKNPNSKYVLDTKANVFYSTAKECSEYSGIKYSYLCGMLNGTFRNTTSYIYV